MPRLPLVSLFRARNLCYCAIWPNNIAEALIKSNWSRPCPHWLFFASQSSYVYKPFTFTWPVSCWVKQEVFNVNVLLVCFGDFNDPLACVRSIQTKPDLAFEPKCMRQAKYHGHTYLVNLIILPKLLVFPFVWKYCPVAWIHMSHPRKVNTKVLSV